MTILRKCHRERSVAISPASRALNLTHATMKINMDCFLEDIILKLGCIKEKDCRDTLCVSRNDTLKILSLRTLSLSKGKQSASFYENLS
jgi:predicted transcriptional regulator